MDEKADGKGRKLIQSYEPGRLEEEIWALAYEQVWPLVRRSLNRKQVERPAESQISPRESIPLARSA